MRNMVIDAGNTRFKIGLYDGDINLSYFLGINLAQVNEYIAKYQPDNILYSSVESSLEIFLKQVSTTANILNLNYNTPIPISYNYRTPQTLGMDRLAAAVGGFTLYPNRDLLIIDLGTCITYDLIDQHGVFQGGIISPGLSMRFRAMHEFTSRLPLLSPINSPPLIGKSTKQSIESGAVNGTLAEIEGIIEQYRNISETICVLICGGDATFFESFLKQPIFAVPELVLIGLNRILTYNVN